MARTLVSAERYPSVDAMLEVALRFIRESRSSVVVFLRGVPGPRFLCSLTFLHDQVPPAVASMLRAMARHTDRFLIGFDHQPSGRPIDVTPWSVFVEHTTARTPFCGSCGCNETDG